MNQVQLDLEESAFIILQPPWHVWLMSIWGFIEYADK